MASTKIDTSMLLCKCGGKAVHCECTCEDPAACPCDCKQAEGTCCGGTCICICRSPSGTTVLQKVGNEKKVLAQCGPGINCTVCECSCENSEKCECDQSKKQCCGDEKGCCICICRSSSGTTIIQKIGNERKILAKFDQGVNCTTCECSCDDPAKCECKCDPCCICTCKTSKGIFIIQKCSKETGKCTKAPAESQKCCGGGACK